MKNKNNYENVLGINVIINSENELVNLVNNKIKNKEQGLIFAINPEKVLKAGKDNVLKKILNNAEFTIPDGIGIVIASKIKKGAIKKRITGIDFMNQLLNLANQNKYEIFLYGGKEEVLVKAIQKIKEKYKGLQIVGSCNGYEKDETKIINKINDVNPDILFVALGSPKQEFFIGENHKKINANIFQGVGGSFDVLAGEIKRAPKILRKIGLEWLYRLFKEPKRIFRQIKLLRFITLIMIGKE